MTTFKILVRSRSPYSPSDASYMKRNGVEQTFATLADAQAEVERYRAQDRARLQSSFCSYFAVEAVE